MYFCALNSSIVYSFMLQTQPLSGLRMAEKGRNV